MQKLKYKVNFLFQIGNSDFSVIKYWLQPRDNNEGCFKYNFPKIILTQTFYGNRNVNTKVNLTTNCKV